MHPKQIARNSTIKTKNKQNEKDSLKSFKGKRSDAEKDSSKKKFTKNKKYQKPKEQDEEDDEEFEVVAQESENPDSSSDIDQDETTNIDHEIDSEVSDLDMESDNEKKLIEKDMQAANRKGKKSGGFQSMGLSFPLFKAIGHMGYKVPTPIQRKAIPVIVEGRDVVAMARTGSGKTAAFLIPMLEKLKVHSAKVGARGIILSPSRELAMQTLKFCKDLGKYTDLRYCVLVGGDSMEEQFSIMASNPDVIIATPGRLMHLILEMSLDLKTTEYVIFDEADRLFEMGFAEQLREILFKLPESRQTLLFSATLPRTLVDFAKAGLTDPSLIRLDLDTKISKDLQMCFFSLKNDQKDATLLYLLRNLISSEEQTIIFVATKHHVEYLHELLTTASIKNTYIYGALDQQARRIHLARFRSAKEKILIVTDVAARGIDIPLLDNVVNYDFPPTCKTFVHRVGRVARAGRTGKAWSLVGTDEVPFMLDLQLFTSRSLVFGSTYANGASPDYTRDVVYGYVPESLISMEIEEIVRIHKENATIEALFGVVKNAYKMYYKSRPTAANESYKRAKELSMSSIGVHPLLSKEIGQDEISRALMVESLSKFRPAETVFEIGKRGAKITESSVMQKRREKLFNLIDVVKVKRKELEEKQTMDQKLFIEKIVNDDVPEDDESLKIFSKVIGSSKSRKREFDETYRDDEHYMPYRQADADIERGYAMENPSGPSASFLEKAQALAFDLVADDDAGLKRKKGEMVWDSKKRNYVRPTIGSDNKKRIKTESGALISASFKTKRFEEWQNRKKIQIPRAGEAELAHSSQFARSGASSSMGGKKFMHTKVTAADPNSKNFAKKQRLNVKKSTGDANAVGKSKSNSGKSNSGKSNSGKSKPELKTGIQITKERQEKDKRKQKTGRHFVGKGGKPKTNNRKSKR